MLKQTWHGDCETCGTPKSDGKSKDDQQFVSLTNLKDGMGLVV